MLAAGRGLQELIDCSRFPLECGVCEAPAGDGKGSQGWGIWVLGSLCAIARKDRLWASKEGCLGGCFFFFVVVKMSDHRAPCPCKQGRSDPQLMCSGSVLPVAAASPGLVGMGRFLPCSVAVGAGNSKNNWRWRSLKWQEQLLWSGVVSTNTAIDWKVSANQAAKRAIRTEIARGSISEFYDSSLHHPTNFKCWWFFSVWAGVSWGPRTIWDWTKLRVSQSFCC